MTLIVHEKSHFLITTSYALSLLLTFVELLINQNIQALVTLCVARKPHRVSRPQQQQQKAQMYSTVRLRIYDLRFRKKCGFLSFIIKVMMETRISKFNHSRNFISYTL